jgi:hypothetical protein
MVRLVKTIITVWILLCVNAAAATGQDMRRQLKRDSVAAESSLAVAAIQYHHVQHNVPHSAITVVRVPLMEKRILLSGPLREPEGYTAVRLFLLERTDSGFVILSRTENMGDAYTLTPAVFVDGQTALVLADVSGEYSWGLSAFLLVGDSIQTLPRPSVAAPEYVDGFGTYTTSALPFVSAFHTSEGIELEFNNDLVRDPGGPEQTMLCRLGERIYLVQQDDGWFVVGATDIRAPVQMDLPRCR